ISEYGTDALRFSLISITAQGQDVFLSKERFEQGRNFANKIWNASRLILMNLKEMPKDDLCQIFQKENLALPERWILSRLYSTLNKINHALDNYRFNEAANLLYEFIWHEFCDWYLEIIKDKFSDRNTQIVVSKVLEKTLRLLHPIMPFITEEIRQKLNVNSGSIMSGTWPHLQKQMIDKEIEGQMKLITNLVTAVRNIRSEWHVDPVKKIDLIIKVDDLKIKRLLEENQQILKNLIKIEKLSIEKDIKPTANCASGVVDKVEFFVPLAELIDIAKEKERLKSQILQFQNLLNSLKSRLKNKDFLKRAPKEIVEKEKLKEQELSEKISKLQLAVKQLS
ncbi:MAG: class I tRNA ligase family protein, partial [Candidatus Omnitrophota bacterium]|nr:class I tRNA ligase family protein [Candidatus Omnitrophota bacterium]